MIKIKQATKKGYIEMIDGGVCDLSYPSSKIRRGRVQGGGNVSPALNARKVAVHQIRREMKKYRIRRLTPKECWRLMTLSGENDTNFEKAKAVCSDSQLYKQAGNSIVCEVLKAIFREMIPEECRRENSNVD